MSGERICAIVPVAGLSSRMGAFKPLLPLRGRTVIENCVESALNGGTETVVAVTGYRADEVESVLSASFGDRVRFARNTAYAESDMLRSVKTGLEALPECDAFFLLPGDMPEISEETFTRLLFARDETPSPVIMPTVDGRQTHPPLIDAGLIPEILSFDGEGGLRQLWKELEDNIILVAVDDAGTCVDLDTPEDYTKMLRTYETGQK